MGYFDKAFFKFLLALALFLFLGFLFVVRVQAQVINELIYSPTAKQWVEIYNNTDASIDLSQYKLLDAGAAVNGHGISAVTGGSTILPAHEYGVVAKDPTAVSASYLFKASLGIKTTGDTVVLKKSSSIIDSLQFADGAITDANSLSRQSDGTWIVAAPTPGVANSSVSVVSNSGSSNSSDSGNSTTTTTSDTTQSTQTNTYTFSSHYSFVPVSEYSPAGSYKVSAGRDRLGFVGVPLAFKAMVNTTDLNAFFVWNFGDGTIAYGREVEHTYTLPGQYELVLNSTLLDNTAVSRVTIKIVVPELEVTEVNTENISVTNKSKYEANLYGWRLQSRNSFFEFPKDTIIATKGTVRFTTQVTKLSPNDKSEVILMKRDDVPKLTPGVVAVRTDPAKQKSIDEVTMKLAHAEKELHDLLVAEEEKGTRKVVTTEDLSQTASVISSTSTTLPWLRTVRHFFGFK